MPSESQLRMNQDTPVGLSNEELRRLNEPKDRAMGQSAVREFERYERGELTEAEMANRARLDAARAIQMKYCLKDPNNPNKFLTNRTSGFKDPNTVRMSEAIVSEACLDSPRTRRDKPIVPAGIPCSITR